MSWFYCNECENFFQEEDARYRLAEVEDCIPRGTKVMCCPNCKSSEIEEVEVCKRCGQPLNPFDRDFCEDCIEYFDKSIECLIEEIEGDITDAKEVFLDYFERRWL